jgi:hypothetical protein
MFLYWRIQQDLNDLGEHLIFHDPSFIRCYNHWVKKNTIGLAIAENLDPTAFLKISMN